MCCCGIVCYGGIVSYCGIVCCCGIVCYRGIVSFCGIVCCCGIVCYCGIVCNCGIVCCCGIVCHCVSYFSLHEVVVFDKISRRRSGLGKVKAYAYSYCCPRLSRWSLVTAL